MPSLGIVVSGIGFVGGSERISRVPGWGGGNWISLLDDAGVLRTASGSILGEIRISGRGSDNVGNSIIVSSTHIGWQAAAATTTLLVSGTSGKYLYIGALAFSAANSGTAQFVSGTGSTCATNRSYLSGPIPLTVNSVFALGNGIGYFMRSGNAGDNICVIATGSGASLAGILSFSEI